MVDGSLSSKGKKLTDRVLYTLDNRQDSNHLVEATTKNEHTDSHAIYAQNLLSSRFFHCD